MSRNIHPAAELFPLIEGQAFDELKADIAKHGQREPVVFFRNQLLDGRNRARACDELGLQLSECELDEDQDPVAYVLSANLHRRHLSSSQRGMVALELEKLLKPAAKERQKASGGDRKSKDAKSVPQKIGEAITDDKHAGETTAQAAKALNVSRGTVDNARVVKEQGSKELNDAVKSGQVSVSKAAKVAKAHDKKSQMAALNDKPAKPERTVITRLRSLFDEMTTDERRQAAVLWEEWLGEE